MDITISPRWKANLSKLVIASLVFPSGLASSASVAKASGYEVLINEVKARGSEYIELFNSGAETVDLTDWKITSAQNGLVANLSGELAGGELKMVEVDDLDNSNDVVSLKDDTDSTKDYVSYGYGAKDLPAADTGKSIARKSNGHSLWLSNVEPSLGENNNYSGPSMPANLRIKVSDLNPANTVNHETQDQAQVSYSVDNQAAQVELQAWDLTGQNKNEIVRSPNSGENSDELNVSNLADGHIYISAYSEDAAGVRSAWLNPVTIGKDTDGPAAPVITMPADKVEANKPNYLIEGSAPKANKINIYNDDKVLVAEMDLDSSEFEISVPLMSGKNKFELVARDQAWNWSDEAKVPTITASNLPLSAPLNLSATADDNRAKLSWMKPVSGGEVEGYRVYWDNQSGQINYNSPLVSLNKLDRDYKTDQLAPGRYKFAVRSFNDIKESASSNIVEVEIGGDQNTIDLDMGEQTVDLVKDHQFWLKTSDSTLKNTAFYVEDFDHYNPTNKPMMGQVAVGSYFDITTSNNSPFPIEIRIFYTQADLDAAGVSDERQLIGLNYFSQDEMKWQRFTDTGVNIDEITIDGQNFKGFFWAKTDHLTPVVGAADIEAPTAVTNLNAVVGDQQVNLSWNKVEDADSYQLKYKPADGNYTYLDLAADQLEILVLKLTNYTNYEFALAAVDQYGNRSQFTTVSATPIPAGEQLAIGGQVGPIYTASSETDKLQEQTDQDDVVNQDQDKNSDQGDIEGGQDERSNTENTRSLVTILIIVVAAAAGFGGYYAYQWWTAQPDDISIEDSPPKEEKEGKKKSRRNDSGRW